MTRQLHRRFGASLAGCFRSAVGRYSNCVAVAICIGLIGWLLSAVPALAVPINYGSFMGTTVLYSAVEEDALTPGDVPPKYGPPTILGAPNPPAFPAVPCIMCTIPGDALDFNPVGFSASSTNGSAADVTDGQLKFMVEPKDKQTGNLFNIDFKEFGDTTLAGNAGTDATQTRVTSDIFIDIVEVNGVGINPIKIQTSQDYTPNGGTYLLGTHGGGTFYNTQWAGHKLVNLAAALPPDMFPPGSRITKITVNMDNTLTALSQAAPVSSSALIAKKDQIIITTNIPEPTSCGLAALAMIVGGCWARRPRR